MGIIKQGILGGFSGKVANIVGSSWKGIAIIKSMPLSVANPKTAGQVLQRGKITNVVAFAKKILSTVIKPLRDRFAVQQSGYNTFVSDNVSLFENAMPDVPANLVLSSGKMASTAIDSVGATTGESKSTIAWTDDTGEGFKLGTDLAYIVVVNETQETVNASAGDVTRADETVDVDLDSAIVDSDTLNAYLSFLRDDGTIVSDSAFNTADA